MLSVSNFDKPQSMQLKPGAYEVSVAVEDKWGAVTLFHLGDTVYVDEAPASSVTNALDTSVLENLDTQGDVNTLLMTLQAQSAIINSVQESEVAAAAVAGAAPGAAAPGGAETGTGAAATPAPGEEPGVAPGGAPGGEAGAPAPGEA